MVFLRAVRVIIVLLGASAALTAQPYLRDLEGIPVTVGGQLVSLPWMGGVNAPSIQLADIDTDGDLDLFVAEQDNGGIPHIDYFRNDGDPFSPNFKMRPHDISFPTFAVWFLVVDLDQDGRLDLLTDDGVTGGGTGLNFYRNEGTQQVPQFSLFAASMLDSSGTPILAGSNSIPALADIDADGRVDFFSGNILGTVNYYRNVGAPGSPNFSFITNSWEGILITSGGSACGGFTAPRDQSERHGASAYRFADIDGDGDFDLFWGDLFASSLYFFRNDGTPQNPSMVGVDTNCYPPNQPISTVGGNQAVLVDIDGDSDLDLFVGVGAVAGAIVQRHGFMFYENIGDTLNPTFERRTEDYLSVLDVGRNAHPAFADLDGNGTMDLFVGNTDGQISYFRNVGTAASPAFERTDTAFAGISGGYTYAPAFVDIDADGDKDLFIGMFDGHMKFYRNTGTPVAPQYTRIASPVDTIVVTYDNSPAFADIDNDGDQDLFVGQYSGRIRFYRNVGDSTNFLPVLENAAYQDILAGQDAVPAFVDIDGDGDFDLFIGTSVGRIEYYENTGDPSNALFVRRTNNYANIDPLQQAVPAFVDIDDDSDADLFVGALAGGIHLYWNQIVASVNDEGAAPSAFRLYQNFPNPFNPRTTIRFDLNESGFVVLKVYDLLGRELSTLISGQMRPGIYEVPFNVSDSGPRPASSGVYLYRLTFVSSHPPRIYQETRKFVLLR